MPFFNVIQIVIQILGVCLFVSISFWGGACDGRGCVFDKEGDASQRPHPQITKHANVAYSSQIYPF